MTSSVRTDRYDPHVESDLTPKDVKVPEVEQRIHEQLSSSPYSTVRTVSCRFQNGTLTLQGQVPNYFSLQAAIHLALSTLRKMKMSPVKLENEIVVAEASALGDGQANDVSHERVVNRPR